MTTCPRNLPQHFNGCSCTTASRTTAEVEADLIESIDDYMTHGFVHLPGLGDISRGRRGGPGTRIEDMEDVAINGTDAERGLLAWNVHGTPEVHDRLAVDRHHGVRAAVAANEAAPPSALLAVATREGGPSTMETRALIGNLNTPAEALEAAALPFEANDWDYPLDATALVKHPRASETLLAAVRDGSVPHTTVHSLAGHYLYEKRSREAYDAIQAVTHLRSIGWEEDDRLVADWVRRADEIAAMPADERPTPEERRAEVQHLVRQHVALRDAARDEQDPRDER
jgi:hypothetical protein